MVPTEIHRYTCKLSEIPVPRSVNNEVMAASNKENLVAAEEGPVKDEPWREPAIRVNSLNPEEVKRRTGFNNLKGLLFYVP